MSRKIILAVTCAAMIMSACGTRRDDNDFGALASGGQAVSGVDAVPGAVDGGVDPSGADGGTGPTAGGAGSTGPGTGTSGTGGATATTGGAGTGGTGASSGSTGATGTSGTPGAAGGPGTSGTGTGPTGGGPNTASDIGVTPTTITIGNVTSYKGLAGPDQFPPFYYGAAAYFNDLNSRGGINGRKVVFQTCDDAYTNPGNVKCVRDFVDKTKVFSFVANACGVCDGLTYAADKKVPSLVGLATDFRSYALQHNWNTSGNPYPQDGKIGWKGKVYYGTALYRFMKQKYGITKAGIVYYENAAPSKNAALGFADQMRAEGITPFLYGLNVALPQYDSAVLDMKSRGVTGLWDTIDLTGNQNLCKSIDSNGLKLVAKMSTSAAWAQKVGKNFSSPCRKSIFSSETPGSVPFNELGNPEVAKFRAAYDRFFPDRADEMHQWSLDGWALAMWFTDAAKSCGANLTRTCVEKFFDKGPYGANGLWTPRGNQKINFDTQKTKLDCVSIVQWDDGKGTFVTRSEPKGTCYTTPLLGQSIT